MKARVLALVCAFLSAGVTARAENVTGNEVYAACTIDNDLALDGFCAGYVIGLVEGLRYGAAVPLIVIRAGENLENVALMADSFLGFCAPSEAQYSQHRDIIVKYLAAHPETRHESARTLAISALAEAFPCG